MTFQRVLSRIAVLAALGASPSAATGTGGDPDPLEAELALLATALRAKGGGDVAEMERCLTAWASLSPRVPAPPELRREADEALARAGAQGALQIFGSRLSDRISVGVRDPGSVVGRIDAWIRDGGEWVRLVRRGPERPDRIEYEVEAVRARDGEVIIDAVMTRFGPERVLRRVRLDPDPLLSPPRAPDPKQLTRNLAARSTTSSAAAPAALREPSFPWWWICAGALAAFLAGAALWQETRF